MAGTVAVAGATGALGFRIALKLAAAPDPPAVVALYRTHDQAALHKLEEAGCRLQRLDLTNVQAAARLLTSVDASILTPVLTVSGPAARAALAAGARRVIVFSSNNVAVDGQSSVYRLLRAEEAVLRAGGGDFTLVRPTMIYGYREDGNLSRLIELARRWPMLPMPGSGAAPQQPIHVDDLAALATQLVERNDLAGRTLAAAGPRAVSQLELYRAVAQAAGRNRLIVPVPAALLKPAERIARALGLAFPLSLDQIARLEADKTPRREDAAQLSGWTPQVALEDGLARLAAEMGVVSSA